MIEIIDGTWAANEVKTFHINGEYIELLDAQYPCDVFLMDKAGAQLSIMKNCEVSFFSKPTGGFNTVQIKSADAQYIRFFVGSGDAGTRRISSTVQVVDGGRARTIAGAAFAASNAQSGGGLNGVQLWNPVGTGKRVVVKSYVMGIFGGNSECRLHPMTAPLAAANLRLGLTKRVPTAASTTEVRVDPATAGAGTVPYDTVLLVASTSINRKLEEPIVLMPGSGIAVIASAGIAVYASFEWTEESLT